MHYHRLSSTVISFYLYKFDIIVDASFWCLNKCIMVCDNFAFSSSNLWILDQNLFSHVHQLRPQINLQLYDAL